MRLLPAILIACFILKSRAARILGVVPTPSFSHQVVFRPIWRELAARGHELVLLTTNPMNDTSLKTVREIDLSGAYQFWKIGETPNLSPIEQIDEMFKSVQLVDEYFLTHPNVKTLMTNKTEHFDLLIIEFLMPTMIGLSHLFKCPYVGVVSMDVPLHGHMIMGNPVTPAIYADLMLQAVPPLSFFERVVSLLFYVGMQVMGILKFQSAMSKNLQKYYGPDVPPMMQMWGNMSMLFINTNPVIQSVRPLGPTTIEFGGGAHIEAGKKLPQDLQHFLDDAPNGAVYFSLGTNVKASWIDPSLLQVFINTLKELPYKVLWKWDGHIEGLPKNVKVINWGPQQDILRHPNVKLFILQGGLQSMEEGIFLNVPMVVIPFFGDQQANAKLIATKRLGVHLDRSSLTKKEFRDAIEEVISDPKYRENIQELARLAKDQPMTGIQKVVWWCEYVIRNKNTNHLRNHAAKVPLYQVLYLDLIALIYVTQKVIRLVFKQIFQFIRKKPKIKTK